MKVIDVRIAAMEIAKIMAYEANMENGGAGYHFTKAEFMDAAKAMLENVPVLEAEVRRSGWWIREPNCWYKCSVCSAHYPSIAANMNYNYCPSCGARMENKDE